MQAGADPRGEGLGASAPHSLKGGL